ncbi:hypothetical protein J2X90_001990 [Variovorax paradoxus]|uniref:O-antigen ligase family protein n=1 Tax=Variovorax paradoxus TaxID=34073 RepID=UPI00278166FB|nr:O-antigen ligase family protein [Variovorax paradoxus]MDQ0024195.1 hypothetical protein [Variovorax paradoxus]
MTRSLVKSRISFATAFLLAGVIYLLLVSGGIFPFAQDDEAKAAVKGVMLFATAFALMWLGIRRSALVPIGLFLYIGLAIGVLALNRSDHLIFAVEKIDGAIVCSAAVALLLSRGYLRFGESELQVAFVAWAFCLLILTVLYKLQFGFFERGVRFFLNGPIVYGWIMGVCSVISFHLWIEKRRLVFLGAFFSFFAALVWTESKGSIMAFVAGFVFYLLSILRRSPKVSIALVVGLLFFYFFLADWLLELISDSRLAAIGRIFSGELSQADDGSVGVRSVLVEKAFQDFQGNPLLGIGLGQFSLDEYIYPHNQHVEIFAELGLFVGLLHVVFVALSFWRATPLNRAVILLFAVGASFSGDASYLRFLYAFCLLGFLPTVARSRHSRNPVLSHE